MVPLHRPESTAGANQPRGWVQKSLDNLFNGHLWFSERNPLVEDSVEVPRARADEPITRILLVASPYGNPELRAVGVEVREQVLRHAVDHWRLRSFADRDDFIVHE
jgi:hypothetical protein